MPEISVIVPIYKVEAYLRRCIDSILAQTFRNFELILVDDGSPDDCPQICDEYAAKDSRIHVIHQANGGLSAARNAGLDWVFTHSNSQWLTFVDSDDWIHFQMLELMLETNIRNLTELCVCGYLEVAEEKELVSCQDFSAVLDKPENFFCEYTINAVVAWGKLYKRNVFNNLRFPVGKIHEDEYITYQVLFRYSQISVIKNPLYYYYMNQDGITKIQWTPRRADAIGAMKKQLVFFKKNNYKKAFECTCFRLAETLMYNYHYAVKYSVLEAWKYQAMLALFLLKNILLIRPSRFSYYYSAVCPWGMKIYLNLRNIFSKEK